MGLDMYLNQKWYVQNWEHNPPENKFTITILQGNKPSDIPVNKITYVITEELYWRKANAIHKWFVDNIQDGNDDCGKYYVESDQLKTLLSLVDEVSSDHSKAQELLPTQSGFFFGTTDYDEYYFKNLEYTSKELHRILKQNTVGEFEYHSSW